MNADAILRFVASMPSNASGCVCHIAWQDSRMAERLCNTIQVCVIGAGKMSRLLLKHMAAKGCKSLVMLNRRCGICSVI
jgi:glutamyl-tRNA reductase